MGCNGSARLANDKRRRLLLDRERLDGVALNIKAFASEPCFNPGANRRIAAPARVFGTKADIGFEICAEAGQDRGWTRSRAGAGRQCPQSRGREPAARKERPTVWPGPMVKYWNCVQ